MPATSLYNGRSGGLSGPTTAQPYQRDRDLLIIVCRYSYANAPIQKELEAREVGNAAAFLLSPMASAVTGATIYVDNGLNAMGLAPDSQTLSRAEQPVGAA